MKVSSGATLVKITRPRLPRVVERERLFRILDQGCDYPMMWISGPAGAGKTTLVASYLDSRKLPCLWYQVDAGDVDPATFFYYMGIAADKAAPRSKPALPRLTPGYGPGIATFARRYFEGLFSKLKQPHILVLDNYQDAPGDCGLHEIVANGASVIPGRFHLIVISRSTPPPAFIRLQANQKLVSVGWEQLRFTFPELKKVMRQQCSGPLSGEIVNAIHAKTGGWVAGVSLACQAVRMDALDSGAVTDPLSEKAFEYFSSELFRRVDVPVQEFLLKTAFVPHFTLETAGLLSGDAKTEQILAELNKRNFFIEKRSQPELSYQYHPLFRAFLLHTAGRTFSEKTIAGLRHKAAQMLEAAGYVDNAVELYREAGEWQEMTRLILKHAEELLAQGRSQTLERWIRAMPAGMCNASPWLIYWQGLCRLTSDPVQARPDLINAYHLFKRSGDRTGLMLAWSGIVDSYLHEWDRFLPLKLWVRRLKQLLGKRPEFPSPDIELAVTVRMLITLLYIRPQDRDLRVWRQKTAGFAEQTDDPDQCMQLSAYLILACSFFGEMDKMHALIENLETRRLTGNKFPLSRIMWVTVKSGYYWFTSECTQSLRLVEEALEISRKFDFHVFDNRIAAQGVYACLTAGDIEKAGIYFELMKTALNPRQCLDVGQHHYVAAYYFAARGELDKSCEHAAKAVAKMDEAGTPFFMALGRSCLAQVLVLRGEHREAGAALHMAKKIGGRMGSFNLKMHVLMVEAQIAHAHGDEPQMIRALRKGLAIGREKNFMGITCWLPQVMELLCPKALAYGIEMAYIRELIRKRGFRPGTPAYHLEDWPWPVKIHTLGRFGLLESGQPLRFSRKVQKKPLEMLKAIIAMGGRQVSEHQLTDALWPEAEGDAGQMLLRTTLHRLRRLMSGGTDAVIRSEGMLALDNRLCWVDVWAFERLLGEAEKQWTRTGKLRADKLNPAPPDEEVISQAVNLTENALALYRGPFLPADADQPWAIALREHLRMRYIRAVGILGGYWERSMQYEKAGDCYQAALRIDEAAEEFYQRLMTCHHKLGRRTEVIKTYQLCCWALKSKLGLDPSDETSAIYRKAVNPQ